MTGGAQQIGFLGLGNMGRPMAVRLAGSGFAVTGWNRTASKAHGIEAEGVTLVASADVAQDRPILCSMLSDDAATAALLLEGDRLRVRHPGRLHIVFSTLSVGFADRLADIHAAAGEALVACPVLGTPINCRQGDLYALIGGADDAVMAARPIIAALTKRIDNFGVRPGQGMLAKAATNTLMGVASDSVKELVVLLRAGGIDPAPWGDLMIQSMFGGALHTRLLDGMTAPSFDPARAFSPFGHSIRIAAEAGATLGVDLPLARALVR